MAQPRNAKLKQAQKTATKRIIGQSNPLALGAGRVLSLFGNVVAAERAEAGFPSREGVKLELLPVRNVKRMQALNEKRKQEEVEKRKKEIAMLVGKPGHNAALHQVADAASHDSFLSRLAQEATKPAITPAKGEGKDWEHKITTTHTAAHATTQKIGIA